MLSQGNLILTWAGDLNATYGYPLYAFDYVLFSPLYILCTFHFLSFSFITSLKLFLALNFILSGVFMYLFSKKFFKNNLTAFTASIFYLFMPYHLVALHFKVTIGEVLAYTLIPLVFYFIHNFLGSKKTIFVLLSGLMLGLVIFSHIAIAIFLIPAILTYIYLSERKVFKSVIYSSVIIGFSLLVSTFQWAAPLIYYPYLFTTVHPPTSFPYFPTIMDLLYSPWRFGLLFQSSQGHISYLIGYAQLLVILIAVFMLIRGKFNKSQKKVILGWLIILVISIFFITPYSFYIWEYIPFINQSGSQRLLVPVAFYISIIAGYVALVYKNKKWLIYALIILAILSTILNWGQRRTIPAINDAALRQDLSLGTKWADFHFYALSKWISPSKMWFSNIPDSHLEILSGKAKIETTKRTATLHEYKINAVTNIRLEENTSYFPGWTATFNNKPVLLKPDNYGVITISLPKGKGDLLLTYKDIFLFQLAKVVSILSVIAILIYAVFPLLGTRRKLTLPKL